MRVAHIGPFSGNSGDLIAYSSFQNTFREMVNPNSEFTNINIREFYKNNRKRTFDLTMAKEINQYDTLVIGGGAYFDTRWSYSVTGTTLDISREFLDYIKIPIIFNSIGYSEPPEGTLAKSEQREIFKKFKRFILDLAERKNVMLTIRNDGSYQRIFERYGKNIADIFITVPDNGFYFDKTILPITFSEPMTTIGLSLANDSFVKSDTINLYNFNTSMAELVKLLISHENARVIFFPQIPKDVETIASVIGQLGEAEKRFHIVVAPYNTLDVYGARYLVGYYKACDYCICMRLHANIIALQNIIPTIGLSVKGLVSGERIQALYKNMGISQHGLYIDSNQYGIAEKLYEQFSRLKSQDTEYRARVGDALKNIELGKYNYFSLIKDFLANSP
ncbi:MAG: polysaccharide pyruvyl transferase family protein [Lachnospiraceae bacterium]|nr:polysaccharide pyruvyl transferase family protein [Lachnospiraceae bacterium]